MAIGKNDLTEVCIHYPKKGKGQRTFVDNSQEWKSGYLRKVKVGSFCVLQRTKKVNDAIKAGQFVAILSCPPVRRNSHRVSEGIFIPGDVISSKNSKRAFSMKGSSKAWVTKSEAAKNYEEATEKFYEDARTEFHDLIRNLEPPYLVGFMFYRKTAADFDFANMVQVVQDMMSKNDWIEDDKCKILLPLPACKIPYEKREGNPGVLISVFKNNVLNQ